MAFCLLKTLFFDVYSKYSPPSTQLFRTLQELPQSSSSSSSSRPRSKSKTMDEGRGRVWKGIRRDAVWQIWKKEKEKRGMAWNTSFPNDLPNCWQFMYPTNCIFVKKKPKVVEYVQKSVVVGKCFAKRRERATN